MIAPEHERFLTERLRTHLTRHSGRTFHAHLSGTYRLLKQWGNAEEVCLAGLFHSIYGTEHFRHKAFPVEDRRTIRAMIGTRAEWLAYVFCVTARPRAFLGHPPFGDIRLHDRHTDEPITVSRRDLGDLLEIEAANLVEQGGRIRTTLERLQQTSISPGAKRAIAAWLSAECHPSSSEATVRPAGSPSGASRR